MRDVSIVGVGMHPWGKFPEKTFVDLGVKAVGDALKDSGVPWKAIQAIGSGIYIWGGNAGHLSGQYLAAAFGETGIPIINVYNACATGAAAIRTAYMSIASGEVDVALAVGVDISPAGFLGAKSDDPKQDRDVLRWRMVGMPNPVYWAIECTKRMAKFGTTEEDLARVKVLLSQYGALNPNARYKKVYTLEEVLNSKMVSYPLRLYEICATSDGAAAVVLCASEKAAQYTSNSISISACTMGSAIYGDPTLRISALSAPSHAEAPLLSESYSASQQAYRIAGIGPEDVNVLELPDNSSWHYLQYLETCGFCGEGEAEKMLRDGETVIGGRVAVCPSGGFSSFGEAIGAQAVWQVVEAINQLRGQCGQRQVPNAKVAMAQTYGLMGNSATTIMKR
ncbi:MAG: lipid-transfer protein [Proteobacteria bacterium]|nr:lipid-transfer protein [Pseudomonadota bacterium]MBU4577122.1 lipid-transfer protein [Pseudomonadota bacterium]MBV1717017.1 lipid-transfer protein [Desulfarculus sp.]